jgi:excisionase family DNA binding protein
MATKDFDPLAYIENAFLDKPAKEAVPKKARAKNGIDHDMNGAVKFRRTKLSAPRPRRKAASATEPKKVLDEGLTRLLDNLPKHIEFLGKFYADDVTSNYYQGEFKETREDLIRRLIDPELTLEEVSRLLGVCPATVRRYTNRGWMAHTRTKGGQRRFRLSHVVTFVDEHGRLPQES